MKCKYCGEPNAKGWAGGKRACEICYFRYKKKSKEEAKLSAFFI